MDFNDDFIIAYFDEETRVFGSLIGYDGFISNDFVGAYICEGV